MKSKIPDMNNDGMIDEIDRDSYLKIIKDKNQVFLSWVSALSMVVVTLILFTPFVEIERISSLNEILDVFYLINGSVVCFYMGCDSYLSSISVSSK